MANFNLEKTIRSPLISGNSETGEILLEGRSYPENAVDFYSAFQDWFNALESNPPHSITFTMDMEYFNTSTAGILYELITSVAELSIEGNTLVIWKYESDDVDMLNKGQSLKKHFGDLIELKEKF